ncbi:MAG: hypothetical protein K9N47_25965 [Prosthecobacter sp.]|uniref:hypothetical protein n=1 Tax=Prosthecobacter sp. TaxID=1965333 RepID=UPI0026252614|nr:hypothetical protein [Prosthecobacter sp.]MCF7789597.1 hypothetical protein [Prosthecobacter sp.]
MNDETSRPIRFSNFKTLWLPFVVAFAGLCVAFYPYPTSRSFRWVCDAFGFIYLGGLLWFLGLTIVSFFQKRTRRGFGALGLLFLLGAALFFAVAVSFFSGIIESKDGFADDLKLPDSMVLAEPHDVPTGVSIEPGNAVDTFQAAIRKSLERPGTDQAVVIFHLPSLARLRKDHPALLDRYLAAHPGWRVYEERSHRFATRRWMDGEHWRMTLHGHYSSFGQEGRKFVSCTTLCFSGEASAQGAQRVAPDVLTTVETRRANELWDSHVVIPAGDLLVELFEESDAPERRASMAAVAELDREFKALLDAPDWSHARNLLPQGGIFKGTASIELRKSFQGGLYNAQIRCNPGAPGRIYLKAFEITQNDRLSEDRLAAATNEWVGGSEDPTEQFFSETHFTIYEGDWGQYYGARFEVWFDPDDHSGERKLLERNFKIEGWMR